MGNLRYLAEGHELGVHSTAHVDETTLTPEQLQHDIGDTFQAIYDATGVRPAFLRPPGGSYNEAVLAEAERQGLGVVLWSIDPEDWRGGTPEEISQRIIRGAADGDIILLHDLSKNSVEAALLVIDALRPKGFAFVTVSELLAIRGETLAPGAVLRKPGL